MIEWSCALYIFHVWKKTFEIFFRFLIFFIRFLCFLVGFRRTFLLFSSISCFDHFFFILSQNFWDLAILFVQYKRMVAPFVGLGKKVSFFEWIDVFSGFLSNFFDLKESKNWKKVEFIHDTSMFNIILFEFIKGFIVHLLRTY